ncbi:MAG TPA: FHA domain-containing protein [Ktedonobacteraceae bacterium]|nr:FHA domain-containing protein [Ktedonobacteraceae bacterium]
MEALLNGPTGRTTLDTGTLTIGRAASNRLVLSDAKTSSHHAEIRPAGSGYAIVDLGSTNGTYVNEQQLTAQVPRPLAPNDSIRIGDTRFTYEVSQVAPTVQETIRGNAPAYQATAIAPPYSAYQPAFAPPPPPSTPYEAMPYVPPYGQPRPAGSPITNLLGNRRNLLIAGIGVLLALFIIVGGLILIIHAVSGAATPASSTPTQTLTEYCTDYKAGNYGAAYDLMTTDEQVKVGTREQFAASQQQAADSFGGVTGCTVSNVSESDPAASGTIIFTTGSGQPTQNQDTLVNQNGVWKISNIIITQ